MYECVRDITHHEDIVEGNPHTHTQSTAKVGDQERERESDR